MLISSTGNLAFALDNKNEGAKNVSENSIVEPRVVSNSKTFSVGGKSYTNYTSANITLSSGAYGSTTIKSNSGAVGENRLYAHANLYNKNGQVVKTADWKSNGSSTSTLTNTTGNSFSKGTFYTKGTTKVYNGNGYTTQSANQSPNVVVNNLGTRISKEELKERMDLYEIKNMLPAVGIDNISGYISMDDLYDEPNFPETPEEAITYQKIRAKASYRMIPLYDNDGKTIIGEYRIDSAN